MNYHYGQTIRVYRLQRGLSQADLARRWPRADGTEGANLRYIQDVEYGKKKISDPATLRYLASLLEIPLWQLGLSDYDPFHPLLWPSLQARREQKETCNNRTEAWQVWHDLQHIPSIYYERMLRIYTRVEPVMFSWTMWNLGLLQLHSQLSSTHQQDITLAVFKCTPSPRVRTIYEITRYSFYLAQPMQLRFYGKETLPGQAIQEGTLLLEEERCAVPILRRNAVGACLFVQSSSVFVSSDIEIIQRYADLFSLAFFDREFYAAQDIDLYTIPADLRQDLLLQEFDLERLDLVSLNITNPEHIQQAERLILQKIVAEDLGSVDVSVG